MLSTPAFEPKPRVRRMYQREIEDIPCEGPRCHRSRTDTDPDVWLVVEIIGSARPRQGPRPDDLEPWDKTIRLECCSWACVYEWSSAMWAAHELQGEPGPRSRRTDATVLRGMLLPAIDALGGTWNARRAAAHLVSQGWRTESERPLNVAGNVLARLARVGEIRRLGRGRYASKRWPS